MIFKDGFMKERSLAVVMAVLLISAFSLVAVALFLQTYNYARGAVDREIRESFRQLHHVLQLKLDYRLKALQHDLNLVATDIQASRYLQDGQFDRLEQMLEELDANNPESSADFRFISVDGKVAWADVGTEFYGLGDGLDALAEQIKAKHRWFLLEVGIASPPLPSPFTSVVMLLRKTPMISPQSGKVLGFLYGGLVLTDNMVLAQSLRAVSGSEAIGIAYNGHWLATTAVAGSPMAQLLNGQSNILDTVDNLTRELLIKGQAVRIEELPSKLAFYSVVQNNVFSAIQRQYMRGGGLALLAVVGLSLLLTCLLKRTTIRPLRRLVDYTHSISTQRGKEHYQPGGIAEFNQVGWALQQTVGILIEKERSLQDLFDYAFSPIIVWDPEMRVMQFNQAATTLIGIDNRTPVGGSVERLFPAAAAESLRLASAGAIIEGVELRYGNGQLMLWNMAPIVIEGRVTAVIAQGLDVTTLKRAEQESHRARRAAEASTRAKSEFLATVSHEIRTPMNGILGMVALLQDTPLNPQQQEYAEVLQSSGRALLTILNDILDFSKMEAGKMELSPVPFNLRRLLEQQLRQFRPEATAKGLGLHIDYAASLPDEVVADDVRIAQIIRNLVGNAIKFTAAGEVCLRVECLQQTEHRLDLRISVKDSGIGISEAGQQRLFQSFSQVDASTTRVFGGTGLGLAICKQLINLMGGEIGVESQPGIGSRFWIRLRLPQAKPLTEDKEDVIASAAPPAAGGHVLLVEDNHVNQKVARIMLEKRGCSVSIAENGQQALDRIAREPFSLVFMDCQMPLMDGYEATRRIRQREAGLQVEHLPVVAMTANTTDGERSRCLEAGMDDYITKPLEPKEIMRVLRRWGETRQSCQ